jgi:ribose transport system permease protein
MISSLFKKYHLGPLIGFICLSIIMSIASSRFLTFGNLSNIALQTSINALLAIGMTFVILTSGIDLSVGATLALSGAVTAGLLTHGFSPWAASIIGLLIGVVAGLFNGILVGYGKLAAFIVTLGTMTLFRGFTEIYTHGTPIFGLPVSFMNLGTGTTAGIPNPVWIMVIAIVIGWIFLNRMTAGRKIYAVGGNEDAAFLAGVPVKRYLVLVYIISGFLAALAGIILTSRLGSAEPTAGTGYELDAITAVVLGGTSLMGGEGTLIGTIFGALILGVINNGLNLLNVNAFYQDAVKGVIILIAIMLDRKKGSN